MAHSPSQRSSPRVDAAPRHVAVELRAATSQLMRAMRATLPTSGASMAQLSVLGQLYRHGDLAPTDLARLEGVRLQTLTRLLATLEEQGWARRQADPADGRRSVLQLTPRGARLLGDHVHRREASLERAITETLSASERRTLLDACALLSRLAAELATPDQAGAER